MPVIDPDAVAPPDIPVLSEASARLLRNLIGQTKLDGDSPDLVQSAVTVQRAKNELDAIIEWQTRITDAARVPVAVDGNGAEPPLTPPRAVRRAAKRAPASRRGA